MLKYFFVILTYPWETCRQEGEFFNKHFEKPARKTI